MSFLPETRELSRPASPELLIGASPLWAYFGAAAATGLAWWWMTRLPPKTLEATFAGLSPEAALSPEPAAEPPPAVGGEAAPISPLAAQVSPEPRSIGAAPEPEPPPARARRAPPPGPPVADA